MSVDAATGLYECPEPPHAIEDGIELVTAASVRPERVSWAWAQRVPIGMVSLLVGQGGAGKSMELCRLAAGWSRGTIEGDFLGTPVDVAIASAEDHRSATIVPRLMAADADRARIHFIQERVGGEAGDIDIDGHVAVLERTLTDHHVRVLLIDTVVAHIPGQHDTYKEQHVRRVLKPLAHMAERHNLVVLGVMHMNRRDAREVLTRISGSGAFGNLARSVLVFGRDPDDPDGLTRILAVGKANVGAEGVALKLALETRTVIADAEGAIPTARLVVVGESSYKAAHLLGPPIDNQERSALTVAEEFLKDLLSEGKAVEAQTVQSEAKTFGIAQRTLWRAAKRLEVKTNDRAGFGPGYPSRWRLPCQTEPTVPSGEAGSVGDTWQSTQPIEGSILLPAQGGVSVTTPAQGTHEASKPDNLPDRKCSVCDLIGWLRRVPGGYRCRGCGAMQSSEGD